ncbi:MAG: hypothetical protein KGL95_05355, partial [Patescibacteria group bacterium]|nr:hypothetical protein [Patescibacteria group bacterium]
KAPSSSAPVSCDIDWWAYVEIDMTTMKILSVNYPTMESHICHGDELGIKPHHAWSITTQDDLNSSNSYYGNYADLNAPDYLSSVFTALNSSYVGQAVNAFFPDGTTGCGTNTYGGCLEQAGWVLGSNGGNHANIVYVDFSKTGTFVTQPTTLKWINGYTTDIQGETDCSPGPANYTITLQNGTNTFAHTTNLSCSTAQDSSDLTNNSVFFENADGDTTQNWSNDITGTVSASSALEFTGTSSSQSWITSNNVDLSCTGNLSTSQVISGSQDSGGTATWSSLNKQPHACY